jgi:hypothetical protein
MGGWRKRSGIALEENVSTLASSNMWGSVGPGGRYVGSGSDFAELAVFVRDGCGC